MDEFLTCYGVQHSDVVENKCSRIMQKIIRVRLP